MSGMVPSFLSSAKLAIYIDGRSIAYATSLTMTDRMATAAVGGIGSYNADAIEPLQYSVAGSFVITNYDTAAWSAVNDQAITTKADGTTQAVAKGTMLPERSGSHKDWQDKSTKRVARGNSFLNRNSFSPLHLLISSTFDINVYEKASLPGTDGKQFLNNPTYKMLDCRLISYSVSFTPGSLLQETIGFKALKMIDSMASVKTINSIGMK